MPSTSADFFQKFNDTFLSDDIEGFMSLIAPDCVWEIMATGETFTGIDEVRGLAQMSVAARTHNQSAHMTFVSYMVTDSQMCLEYIHEGIITADWPASQNRPEVGSKFELPICLVCRTRDGKFVSINEYFDLGTLVGGGRKAKLYS